MISTIRFNIGKVVCITRITSKIHVSFCSANAICRFTLIYYNQTQPQDLTWQDLNDSDPNCVRSGFNF